MLFLLFFFLGFYFLDSSSFLIEFFLPFSILGELPISFFFDYVSFFFFSFVSLISRVVFLYRKFYMEESFSRFYYLNSRFFFLLFLFVISIMVLVFSGSWVVVMVGWDGLGLVSFLLVIFYNNSTRLDSGLITVFTNRLGDCFFILSFIFIFYCGWFFIDYFSFYSSIFFCLVVFLGCVTKSAQLPFSSWLPAAMAAPTPVSSLVHSSTLVTAGVYLLIRFNFLLDRVFYFLLPISLFTIFFSGFCAVYELDFKKVVAMSTLRQLGFMVFSITSGLWVISFVHMIFHAFFKSSLFLSTGNLMHYLSGDQDSRFFGSIGVSFFSKLIFSLRVLSLMGFPFSMGFYTKDSVVGEFLFSDFSFLSFIFFISCCFTVSYRLRLLYMGFMKFPSFINSLGFLEDSYFFLPLIILYSFCVFFGNCFFFYFLSPVVFSFLDFFFGVFIIFFGYLLFKFFYGGYFFIFLGSSIFFLSTISTSFFSNFVSKFSFKGEYTWGEILGGGGLWRKIVFVDSYAKRLYLSNFSLFFILTIIFFTLWL